jgi:hypothetical protein
VFGSGEGSGYCLEVDDPSALCIQHAPGLFRQSPSALTQVASQGQDKLLTPQAAVLVKVELVEHKGQVVLSQLDFEIPDGLGELPQTHSPVSVRVSKAQASGKANHPIRPSQRKRLSDHSQDLTCPNGLNCLT